MKYLFAPDIRTCPPLVDNEGNYSEDSYCPARVKEPLPTPKDSADGGSRITVSQGTNYARQIEQEYIGAKAQYGSVASSLGVLIIPAGASALALGAEGISSTAVTALGFGSAALLGEGYWLTNKPREKVYMTGASALECLIDTMQPFDVEQTNFTIFERI